MIVSIYTVIAQCAMAAPRRPDNLTIRAQAASFHRVQKLHEAQRSVTLDHTRIAQPYEAAENAGESKQDLAPHE